MVCLNGASVQIQSELDVYFIRLRSGIFENADLL